MDWQSHLRYLEQEIAGLTARPDILRLEWLRMDKSRVAKFEDILTKKREELRRNLARTQEERSEAHEFGRDEGDRATASLSKEMSFRQKAQERGLLMLVEAALGRVNNGTFGECLNCGQEIGANRLTAVPWSRYCITCQELIVEQQ